MVIKKMKKNNKVRSPENSEAIKKETVTSMKKIEQEVTNSSFPQEFEEQRSMDIRMKPQPLAKPEKSGR
jgi:hypothetical protein